MFAPVQESVLQSAIESPAIGRDFLQLFPTGR